MAFGVGATYPRAGGARNGLPPEPRSHPRPLSTWYFLYDFMRIAQRRRSSDISLAHASADQMIVQSKRAVEIETLKAQAEVEPLERMAGQLGDLKSAGGAAALRAYVRNVRLELYHQAHRAFVETRS